ncbi:MAG: GNAT family N-acetyltransferase, partial [Rhizobacter sp.]|nr:GNAT family N-acetyltransferase [Rhizobacter sp.]
MNTVETRVRRVTTLTDGDQQSLAELLIDCVAGGASVSFMHPLSMQQALSFWRGVADGVARGDRALLTADDPQGRVVGSVQLV